MGRKCGDNEEKMKKKLGRKWGENEKKMRRK